MDFSSFADSFSDIYFQSPSIGVIFSIFLVIFVLYASGFSSASEIAFFSLKPVDLAQLEDNQSEKASQIKLLRSDSERTLATILIMNNFANVTVVMLTNYIFAQIIHFGPDAYWIEFLIVTVILTFLILLFGEIMPKIMSRQNSLKVCFRNVKVIMFFRKFFWWLSWILMKSSVLASKVVQQETTVLGVDELEQALKLTDNNEIQNEKDILQGIIRFGDETAKDVMTVRNSIVSLDIRSDYSEVLSLLSDVHYSRIPVYHDNDDNIRGILYIKDLLPFLDKPAYFRWQSLIRSAYFVPETKKIDALLREFQVNKVHIAIVVDEFGGTAGLVTLEDILEEIVGEITDEYDQVEQKYTQIGEHTYIFEGKILLSDFCKILRIGDEEFEEVQGNSDSLAGLLLELKGDFLELHEIIHFKKYTFEIIGIEEKRISRIKVTIDESGGSTNVAKDQ